jgi:hypothetical protein
MLAFTNTVISASAGAIGWLIVTYPAAGVITTNPANAPSKSPSKLVVFLKIYSKINQPMPVPGLLVG